jgi:hypothetical protein
MCTLFFNALLLTLVSSPALALQDHVAALRTMPPHFFKAPNPESSNRTQRNLRILWVGNSLTFTHDFPQMVTELAAAAGVTIQHVNYTYHGWLLMQHAWPNSTFRHELHCEHVSTAAGARDFDFVVLQDESRIPGGGRVFPVANNVTFDSLDAALNQTLPLLTSVFGPCIFGTNRSSGAKAVLYQTWGRIRGDRHRNRDIFPTFERMTERTVDGYEEYARHLRSAAPSDDAVIVARVGEAREVLKASHPEYHDHMYVGKSPIHPTLMAVYLDAIIMLKALVPDASIPSWAPTGVSEADAALMRSVSSRTFAESHVGPRRHAFFLDQEGTGAYDIVKVQ